MTKEQYVSLIIDYLAGGNCPADLRGRYHPQIIEKYLDMVFSEIVYQAHANAVTFRDFGQLDAYAKALKNVQVDYDQDRDEHYSVLPDTVIGLPMNRGIRSISPMQDQKSKFWYSENNTVDVYDELEVGMIINKTRYYVEGGRVYYRNYDDNITDLLFKLIVPIGSMDDEDEIPIPAQNNAQVFNMIISILRQKPPEKQSNDNNAKTQV